MNRVLTKNLFFVLKRGKFYEIYDAGIIKPIFNVVASNLIFSVEKGHNLNTDKEKLRTIFYKEIGDPRLDTVRWNSIDPEAKRIFINFSLFPHPLRLRLLRVEMGKTLRYFFSGYKSVYNCEGCRC